MEQPPVQQPTTASLSLISTHNMMYKRPAQSNQPTMYSGRNRRCKFSAVVTSLMALILIITATLFSSGSVDALKLTSLGSTLDNHKSTTDGTTTDGSSETLEDLDYSSLACSSASDDNNNEEGLATCSSSYGVDNSFPIHHSFDDTADDTKKNNPLNGEQKELYYNEFMKGCREKYNRHTCDGSEVDRISMNLRQPKSMFNYTTLGFHKVQAPPIMVKELNKFWNRRFKSISNINNETWSKGNTYTNHWSSPTKMISIANPLRKTIWDASKEILEEWVGVELSQTSLYGTRVYTEGSILAPHVDRNPLVISGIINVAQDVDEPWPLEVYGHDGNAYNITMEPGDMIFYESHSVIHGRPFPLKGRYYANVFVHFEPLGHTLKYEEENSEDEESLQHLYQKAWKKLQTKCSDDEDCKARVDLNVENEVPHYIVPGSEEERRWLQTHPKAKVDTPKDDSWIKSFNVHTAASTGDLDSLIAIATKNPELLKKKDNNGWNALHEAVRGGHVDVVKYLIEKGSNKNERTHSGDGGSPLWWAKKTHGNDHPMVVYLESIGAKEIPPQGHKKFTEEK